MKPTRTRRTAAKRSAPRWEGLHRVEVSDLRALIAPAAPELVGLLLETALTAPTARHRDEAHEILASRGLWPAGIPYPFARPAAATAIELEIRHHHRDTRTGRRRTYTATRRIEFTPAA